MLYVVLPVTGTSYLVVVVVVIVLARMMVSGYHHPQALAATEWPHDYIF